MRIIMLDSEIKMKITSILLRNGVTKIGIFGSYAREEEIPESDIDILVEFSEVKSLLELIGIENELSEALQIKVDLLTEKAISPYLIEGIRRELEVIYE